MSIQSINDETVAQFKSDVITACPSLVTLKDQYVARSIPNTIFEKVFRNIFDGDNALAKDVLFGRMEKLRNSSAEKSIDSILTMQRSASLMQMNITANNKFLLISDTDNDGALAQSIAMEARKLLNIEITVQPKDYNVENHGFSIEQIDAWVTQQRINTDEHFLVVIADLGTNQRQEQDIFLSKYPKGTLIIVDHHKPELELMINPDAGRSILVSPYVKGSVELSLRDGGGVSSGYLLYSLIKNTINNMVQDNQFELDGRSLDEIIMPMRELGLAANLLDQVECDLRLKPLHEADIKKALDIASVTKNSRSVSRWIAPQQVSALTNLLPLVGKEKVSNYLELRDEIVELNHFSHGLLSQLPLVLRPQEGDKELKESLLIFLATTDAKDSIEDNFAEKLNTYIFNLSYENQMVGRAKTQWLDMATDCLGKLGAIEIKLRALLREDQLIRQISAENVIITQAASPEVEKAFTSKQLSQAYQSLDKPIKISVLSSYGNKIVMSSRSNISMHEVLANANDEFKGARIIYKGHGGAGGLTLINENQQGPSSFQPLLDRLVSYLNNKSAEIISKQSVKDVLEVEVTHLPLLKEMFEKMRAHLTPTYAPDFLLRLNEETVFQDGYTLEKKLVRDIVKENEWLTTNDPLSFDRKTKLSIPNQALKSLAKDGFKGMLSLKLTQKGSFFAERLYTGEQLKNKTLPKMIMPIEKERAALLKYYKQNFHDRDYPAIAIPRDEAIAALKFAADSESVFKRFEANTIGFINKLGADSYVVLDVEADGTGNAEAIEVGLSIYEKDPKFGDLMSRSEFESLVKNASETIDNYTTLPDGNVMVNERIRTTLVSIVIGKDGDRPINVSTTVQNLTNFSMDFLREVGVSSEVAQERILNVLKEKGKFVIQAHNLPYDNNIVRVNFPEVYTLMSSQIHLDSAVIAKNKQVAYTGLKTNKIDGVEFYNAESPGYNLSTLINDQQLTEFTYPSLKGTHVLEVSGQDVHIFNLDTRVRNKLKLTRDELSDTLLPGLSIVKSPRFGIQKLLLMATIRDLIDHQPVKETVYIPFDGLEQVGLSNDLWAHFQRHYAFDRTIEQNIHDFMVIPEVAEHIKGEFVFDSAPKVLVDARSSGTDEFDPKKEYKSKAAKEKYDKKLKTFSAEDIMKMNTINFLASNQQNAARYANSWLYELVLNHHEITEKSPSLGFLSGIAERTGVDIKMIETIHAEAYRYKKFRGIQSYRVHEAHNNIGLYGDAYQESIVVMHLLDLKVSNPYITNEIALKYNIQGNEKVIETLVKQAASSTLKQSIRMATEITIDDDKFNSYAQKQLEHFSEEGISIKSIERTNASMKCKTLSDDESEVIISLPEYDPKQFKTMTKEERFEWENKMEKAVTILILANSLGTISSEPVKKMIEELLTNESSVSLLKEVKEHFGPAYASNRENQVKNMLARICDLISDASEEDKVKPVPVNKEINYDELETLKIAVENIISQLETQQNFTSYLSADELNQIFEDAKNEYFAMETLLSKGEKIDSVNGNDLRRSCKAALTSKSNKMEATLSAHIAAFSELALSIDKTKKDPLSFLLKSPLATELITHSLAFKKTNLQNGYPKKIANDR